MSDAMPASSRADHLREGERVGVGEVVREGRPLDGDDRDAVLGELLRQRVDAVAQHERRDAAAGLLGQGLGRGDAGESGLRELAVQMLGDD
jgi:hypothetical protein